MRRDIQRKVIVCSEIGPSSWCWPQLLVLAPVAGAGPKKSGIGVGIYRAYLSLETNGVIRW